MKITALKSELDQIKSPVEPLQLSSTCGTYKMLGFEGHFGLLLTVRSQGNKRTCSSSELPSGYGLFDSWALLYTWKGLEEITATPQKEAQSYN